MGVFIGDDDPGPYTVHAGNVPLLWMREEAAAHGLVFDAKEFTWDPEDVDFGTSNLVTRGRSIVETLLFRRRVLFGGTGKHGRR